MRDHAARLARHIHSTELPPSLDAPSAGKVLRGVMSTTIVTQISEVLKSQMPAKLYTPAIQTSPSGGRHEQGQLQFSQTPTTMGAERK